jgi:RNA polymerase subunit RPABC4/transcription elongation factor Spt4
MTMFCSSCGNKLSDTQKFCPSCGVENANPTKKTNESSHRPKDLRNSERDSKSCPECNQKDLIQKVSSIWSTDESEVEGRTTLLLSARYQGSTKSGLARRLSAPVGPWVKKESQRNSWIGCGGCIVVLGVPGLLIAPTAIPDDFISFLVFLGVGIVILFVNLRSEKKSKEEREAQKKLWEKSTQRLGQAWYCSRDDLVFDARFSGSPEKFVTECFSNI